MVALKLVDAHQVFLPPFPAASRSPSPRRRSPSAPGCFHGRRPLPASKLNAGSMPFEALLNCKSRHTKGSTCAYSLFDEDMVKIGNVDDVSLEKSTGDKRRSKLLSAAIKSSFYLLSVTVPCSMQPVASAMPCDHSRCTEALIPVMEQSLHETFFNILQGLVIADLDPATAKLAVTVTGPFLSAFGFLFILRIVMSWYPKLPLEQFPYVIAYAPTEPILSLTRKLIPPLAGVDVTPVVWFGLVSFLNEILVGPQGKLSSTNGYNRVFFGVLSQSSCGKQTLQIFILAVLLLILLLIRMYQISSDQ